MIVCSNGFKSKILPYLSNNNDECNSASELRANSETGQLKIALSSPPTLKGDESNSGLWTGNHQSACTVSADFGPLVKAND